VVLGPVGRNVAAGMSGGIAWFWDPEQLLADQVNYEMVDLDPLTDEDREFLLDVVRRHRAETGSAVAERLLARWDEAVGEFRKIMPKDYKRVLTAMQEAEARGVDALEAVMAASKA
jgi:glutamate synthase domain-containing protein 3